MIEESLDVMLWALEQNDPENWLSPPGVTRADIDALIVQMPQFQVDGVFNRDRFVATVRNMGMGVAEFREAMRRQYVINQIRAAIAQSGLATAENARQLLRIQTTKPRSPVTEHGPSLI